MTTFEVKTGDSLRINPAIWSWHQLNSDGSRSELIFNDAEFVATATDEYRKIGRHKHRKYTLPINPDVTLWLCRRGI